MITREQILPAVLALCMLAIAALEPFPAAAAPAPIYTIGYVTWYAAKYVDQVVTLRGYLLAREKDYVLFSDEPKGKISAHDLPV